jgi:integral membrane protein (TIGR01906 family)
VKNSFRLFILSIVLIAIFLPTMFLFTKSFYRIEAARHSLNDEEQAYNVLEYLHGNSRMDSSVFTEKEISHMRDVKRIYIAIEAIFLTSVCYYLAYGSHIYRKRKQGFFSALRISGYIMACISVMLLVAALFFEDTFEGFHKLFFDVGSYIFSGNEMLPKLFPMQFFFDAFAFIIAFLFFTGAALFMIFGRYSRKSDK